MKLKVLIVTLNSKYIHSSLAPWCLYTAFKSAGIKDCECRVVEGTINEKDEIIYERLIEEKPDFIAFSCYIWNIEKTLRLAEKLRKNGITIALGGPEVSYRQEDILKNYPFVDYVLSGEGENVLPRLVSALVRGDEPEYNGISKRKNGVITVSQGGIMDFESTVSPYCEEYFSTLGNRIAYIESSRGCPYSCAFCLSGRCGKVRFLPLERIKNEILLLTSKGAKTVKFVDRTFNCKAERAAEILTFIKDEYGKAIPDDACFHFEIAADILTGKLFDIISQLPVGAVQFEVGIQSFNEETLKSINRKTDVNLVESNVKRLLSYGNCHVHIDLIAGLPYEDYESFVKGFNRAYNIGANMLQPGFLKLLYGSDMRENKEAYPCRYGSVPPYEVISTPWINEDELRRLHICENELDRLYNSGRFSRTLSYLKEKKAPFNLFYDFGEYLEARGEKGSIPLDRYACLAYEYFSGIEGVDKVRLRDLMLLDRISTNSSDVIPSCLKVRDERLAKIRRRLSEMLPSEKASVRSVAILYSVNAAVYCDYGEKKNPVTGQWEIKRINSDV